MPRLSVVVPFHNVAAYVHNTLRSLQMNSGPGIEFLLVDDCSTDETSDAIDKWQQKLPGSSVLRHNSNQGIAQARNTGIDAATGDFITFLDGDDWYRPGYLQEMLDAIDALGCDFLRVDHVRSTGTTRVVERAPARLRGTVMDPRDGIVPVSMTTMVDYPFVWAGIYSRRLFEDGRMRFETGLRTAEDRLWVWRLHLAARSYAVAGLYGVFYRRGVTTSLTQIRDARQLDFMPAFETLLREVGQDREAARFLPKVARTYCAMIAFHMGKADEYEPPVAQRLKRDAGAALRRMPQDVLDPVLDQMDDKRKTLLERLRGDTRRAV